jgi:serine protease Do
MRRWSVAFVCLVAGASAGSFVAGPWLHGQAGTPPADVRVATGVPKELTSYRDVVKKVLPAVVSIESRVKAKARPGERSERSGPRRPSPFQDFDVPEDTQRFLDQMEQRGQEPPDDGPHVGFGSGFLVDPKGVILTNYHVVAGADELVVQLKDGRKFTTKKFVSDRKTDLAIVRIEAKAPLPYLELGDSDAMEIGDRVLAVGAPFGLTGSVTAGIISAKGRNGLHMNLYEDFLQTDAAINPGNSGGPLVNLEGKVIGINAAIKSRSGGFQGVGLAIASNLAKNVMEQLAKDGTVHRGYLGVQIRELDPEVAARLGLQDKGGVAVAQVFDGSPAAKGGLEAGDIITAVAGKPIKDGSDLQRQVAGLPLKKPSEITVLRDGKAQTLKVTIEEQPDKFGVAEDEEPAPRRRPRGNEETLSLDKVGVEVTDLTPQWAERLGFKDSATGALVTGVDAGSPAAHAGLRRGMLIVEVDKKPVDSAKALQGLLAKAPLGRGTLLKVQSPQGGVGYLLLKVEDTK